jgi:ribonuclease HI
MYFDGSLNIDGARAGVLFISPNKDKLRYVLRLYFPASNNAAEYEACLHNMRIMVELGIKRLYVYGDSALVINQLNKDWDMTSEKIDSYCKEIRKLEGKFYGIEYAHVVQDKNKAADELSKLGSSRATIPHGVFVQDLVNPSIKEAEDHVVEKPLDQQLVATVPIPITTEPPLTTRTLHSTTDNSD